MNKITHAKFKRQDSHKKPKLSRSNWRKPKGIQSKMRLKLKGYGNSPNTGYGTPVAEKGKVNGLALVNINNVTELASVNTKEHSIIVSGKIGTKKRIEILKEALKLGIIIHNIKNPEQEVQKIELKMAEKKKAKTETEKTKKTKLEDRKKKADEKEKKESETDKKVDDIEKKKQEKKDIDKILTSKE